jgi:hypothetical protein
LIEVSKSSDSKDDFNKAIGEYKSTCDGVMGFIQGDQRDRDTYYRKQLKQSMIYR